MEMLTGGCLCGGIRFESAGALRPATFCHCSSCRRASGSHVLGFVTVAQQDFQFTRGHPTEYRSSKPVLRTFCPRCGTPLTYWHERWPAEISLTLGSVDNPNVIRPTDHTWMSEAVSWDDPTDELPRFPTDRPGTFSP
jgi:hypothetical protein